ncbi:MAG TPA: Phenylacetic acid catabolic protein [Candidatus Limnocylindria bacterium]|nr:Phenylacetic acid catabolic protein [Candidatus Limnocylindria bacterium]
MADLQHQLPRQYHEAVGHWQRHNFPDYPRLAEQWDTYFPKDDAFCLCARIQQNMPDRIEVGDRKGEPKAIVPRELDPKAAEELLAIIRAQASTEFGSIQQHQATLARASDPQDQAWVLRVMAEELRHGYQMIHLLTSADWSPVTDTKPQDMVEEILSMKTGSHVLAAFNLEYDSFVDNVVFAAFIDRVGKYQLTMQKVNAYQPMAASMPPMLREEAFHLAAGVIPMRRWAEAAARPEALITMQAMQRAVCKWFPRGLEMFGDERGGTTNVRLGLKDKTNRVAQDEYIAEVDRMLDDINQRHVRARFPQLSREDADALYGRVKADRSAIDGLSWDADLLKLPHAGFFRRRGEHAFQLIGVDGSTFEDVERYIAHVRDHLPEAYLASIDVKHWAELQRGVANRTVTLENALKSMPRLARVGGACPCANSVRWVVDVDVPAPAGEGTRLNP